MATVTTSIGTRSSDAVTANSVSGGPPFTVTLSASVPATTVVGDTFTDNGGNRYLIDSISGSDIIVGFFDSVLAPVTGVGTTERAYATITLWEAGLDTENLYASSDDAVGECYDDSAFDESVTIDGGGTIGLNSVTLTVASEERHDGTAGTGARIVATVGRSIDVKLDSIDVEWLEIDNAGNLSVSLITQQTTGGSCNFRGLILHDSTTALTILSIYGYRQIGTNNLGSIQNTIIYDILDTASALTTFGIRTENNQTDFHIVNVTVHNIKNDSTGSVFGISLLQNDADNIVKNNIVTDTGGTTSGTIKDYDFAGTTIISDTNLSSDDTADDAGGSGHLLSKTSANQFVSTAGGSEDFHLKSGADAIGVGTDLGTTPTGVNFDIDNRDRDAENDDWDMGADQTSPVAVTDRPFASARIFKSFIRGLVISILCLINIID